MMIEYDDMCDDLSTKDIVTCSDDMKCYDYLMHERVERKIEERKRNSGREDKRLAKRVTGRKERRMITV
jgi:hypothetical protein